VALCGALTKSLKGVIGHVPYLQGRRHADNNSMQNACYRDAGAGRALAPRRLSKGPAAWLSEPAR
jgi:hypothetical protein